MSEKLTWILFQFVMLAEMIRLTGSRVRDDVPTRGLWGNPATVTSIVTISATAVKTIGPCASVSYFHFWIRFEERISSSCSIYGCGDVSF